MATPIDRGEVLYQLERLALEAQLTDECEEETIRRCIKAIEQLVPTLTPPNEWVSVEERLPTIEKGYCGYGSVSVNVFNGKSVLPMDYESSVVRGKKIFRWKYPWGRIYDGEPITHWMPLPEPPTKEE